MGADKLFVLVYQNQDVNTKRFRAATYYLPKIIIKNYDDIINEKNFYDQPADYDIKQRNKKIKNRSRGRLHYWIIVRL